MKISIYLFAILTFFACSKKEQGVEVNAKKTKIANTDSEIEAKIIKLEKAYRFDDYKVKVFSGELAKPDFNGNEYAHDSKYVDFIQSGCKRNGINFGGHFTIIEKSCGALCGIIFIVDRIDGRIFLNTKPNDGSYGFKYKVDSTLLIANSETLTNEDHTEYTEAFDSKPAFYIWKKDNFVRLE